MARKRNIIFPRNHMLRPYAYEGLGGGGKVLVITYSQGLHHCIGNTATLYKLLIGWQAQWLTTEWSPAIIGWSAWRVEGVETAETELRLRVCWKHFTASIGNAKLFLWLITMPRRRMEQWRNSSVRLNLETRWKVINLLPENVPFDMRLGGDQRLPVKHEETSFASCLKSSPDPVVIRSVSWSYREVLRILCQ
jgi:hypothetical protein